jgi:hypothetical protein
MKHASYQLDGQTMTAAEFIRAMQKKYNYTTLVPAMLLGFKKNGGLHIVPEDALAALATQNISYVVKGKATYEQEMAALRGDAASAVQ